MALLKAIWQGFLYLFTGDTGSFTRQPTVLPTVPPNVVAEPEPPPPPPPPLVHPLLPYDWSTPEAAKHSARLICDEEGLPLEHNTEVDGKYYQLKDILCACIMQESGFHPLAIGKPNKNGTQDFGLCQYNNGKDAKGRPLWIGPGATFSSVEEVLDNPAKNVRVMARCFKMGEKEMEFWSSYKYGAYKQWL